jgi:hypothetical protein
VHLADDGFVDAASVLNAIVLGHVTKPQLSPLCFATQLNAEEEKKGKKNLKKIAKVVCDAGRIQAKIACYSDQPGFFVNCALIESG